MSTSEYDISLGLTSSDADYLVQSDTLAEQTTNVMPNVNVREQIECASTEVALPTNLQVEPQTISAIPLQVPDSNNHFVQVSGVSNTLGYINENGNTGLIEQMVGTPVTLAS